MLSKVAGVIILHIHCTICEEKKEKRKRNIMVLCGLDMLCPFTSFLSSPLEHESGEGGSSVPIFVGGLCG